MYWCKPIHKLNNNNNNNKLKRDLQITTENLTIRSINKFSNFLAPKVDISRK